MPYIVGGQTKVGDELKLNLVGYFDTLDEAKQTVNNFSPVVIKGDYVNVTIFQFNPDENKVYTFTKDDLQPAYDKIQVDLKKQGQ